MEERRGRGGPAGAERGGGVRAGWERELVGACVRACVVWRTTGLGIRRSICADGFTVGIGVIFFFFILLPNLLIFKKHHNLFHYNFIEFYFNLFYYMVGPQANYILYDLLHYIHEIILYLSETLDPLIIS